MSVKLVNDLHEWVINTPSYKYSSLMDEVIRFLKSNFNITFFHYAQRFEDGNYFEITTDRTWGLSYVTKYMTSDTFTTLKHLKNDIWVWGDGVTDRKEIEMHAERTEVYGIPQGLSFIQNNTETFSYSSNQMSDAERIQRLIEIRTNKLGGFEKNFVKSIQSAITACRADLKLPLIAKTQELERKLTIKEITIIGFLAKGFKPCEISKLLSVTEGTIKNRIDLIKEKLCCKTREQIIAISAQRGHIQ